MSETSSPNSALVGTWKLLLAQFEFGDNGERHDLFGPTPIGRLILTEAGDFMTVITSTERIPAADATRLFETMMAYAGKFRLDGNKIVIGCDVSWHPSWVGTDQVRFFRVDGSNLHLRTGAQTHPLHPDRPGYGVIDWRRES
jgi:hypothetical protein